MNGNPDRKNSGDGIELIDLSSNREMEAIRRNEALAKQERQRRAAAIRRKEMLRRKRIAQIKRAIFAWCVIIFALIVLVAAIIGIASLFKKDEKPTVPAVGNQVDAAELSLVAQFRASDEIILGESAQMKNMSQMLENMTSATLDAENPVEHISELYLLTDAYSWNSSLDNTDAVRNFVRDVPIFSNGYVYSSKQSMKSPVTGSYFYDTNSSYIISVAEICHRDGSDAFLSQVDVTDDGSKDVSKGMTVGEKIDLAAEYFFDTADLNGGGLRFNMDDGLVYVLTEDNNGTSSGKPSNLFFNYRFGYLDAYNNILFNKAMQSLSYICKLREDTENSEKYSSVAENNKKAINEKFFDGNIGRYIGCIDSEGRIHDGGFTAVNLAAISFGVADKEKTEKILSWIDGKTQIVTDSLDSKQIMQNPAKPVFSTVKATDSWWDYVDGEYPLSSDARFGKYWMNGGESTLCGYFDLLARESAGRKHVKTKLDSVFSAYADGTFALDNQEEKYPQPNLYYAALASNAVKKSFGITADGKTLGVVPSFTEENDFGIRNISFNSNRYSILFDETGTYVVAEYNAAVKLKIGGFAPDSTVSLTVVEDESVLSAETTTADKNGCVVIAKRFGDNSYIRLCEEEQKK